MAFMTCDTDYGYILCYHGNLTDSDHVCILHVHVHKDIYKCIIYETI